MSVLLRCDTGVAELLNMLDHGILRIVASLLSL
jgi:hypothetical protein